MQNINYRCVNEADKLKTNMCLPQIYIWEVKGMTAYLKCSPVSRINIITGGFANAGAEFKADTDEDFVTAAKWKLRGDESFIKAELIDNQGHIAESPVIYLKN